MNLMDRLAETRNTLTSSGAPFELDKILINGIEQTVYKNAPDTLTDVIKAARKDDDECFLSYQEDHWSYRKFYQTVDSLASWMHHHGVKPGQPVAIAMRNRPEWAAVFVATALLGGVPAPLNSFCTGEELVSAIDDIQPILVVCDHTRLMRLAGQGAVEHQTLLLGTPVAGVETSRFDVAASYDPISLPEVSITGDDPALILFTSGATSCAKAVLSSQRAVCQALTNIDYISALSAMSSPELIQNIMAKGLPQVLLTAVPLFHVSGLHAQLLTALRTGRRLIFIRRWDTEAVVETMKNHQVTQFNGAPSMVLQLLREPGFEEAKQNLSGLGFGGAGIPAATVDFVLDTMSEQMIGIGFGMTETNGVGAAGSGELFKFKPEASGVVSPIVQIRICSPEGDILPLGETGEIQLKGVSIMDEYVGNPEATSDVLSPDQWLSTGDLGYLDEHGYLFIVDRLKDVINRAGENVSAAEVESCLLQHDEVLEAAVFGIPDEETGEAVVAAVHVNEMASISEKELRKFAAEHIAAYKVPSVIQLTEEALPKNPSGKILKKDIKQQFAMSKIA